MNLYIDEHRKNKKLVFTDRDIELTNENVNGVITMLNEQKLDLIFFLRQLKTEERLVTWLFSVEGYKHREIAEKLSISLSNSKQIFRRSMQKLIDLSKSYE